MHGIAIWYNQPYTPQETLRHLIQIYWTWDKFLMIVMCLVWWKGIDSYYMQCIQYVYTFFFFFAIEYSASGKISPGKFKCCLVYRLYLFYVWKCEYG